MKQNKNIPLHLANEDAYYTILSFLSFHDLINLAESNQALHRAVKSLLEQCENHHNIFKNSVSINTLKTVTTPLSLMLRPLTWWLNQKVHKLRAKPFTFTVVNNQSKTQDPPSSTKLILDNKLQVYEIQASGNIAQSIANPYHLSATGTQCTLFTNRHGKKPKVFPHKGKQSLVALNEEKLQGWIKKEGITLKSIIAGEDCFILVTQDGKGYCVGANRSNMFYERHEHLKTPKPIFGSSDLAIKKVALSKNSLAIIDQQGRLYTKGTINAFLHDDQMEIDNPLTNATPILASHEETFLEVSIQDEHLIALSSKHELWGLGRNTHNQIGLHRSNASHHVQATVGETRVLTKIPFTSDHDNPPVHIHTNLCNSFFTTKKGQVYGCGKNIQHILGLPNKDHIYPFTQIPLREKAFITQVFTSMNAQTRDVFSILISQDRKMFWSGCWQNTLSSDLHQEDPIKSQHITIPGYQDFRSTLLAKHWKTPSPKSAYQPKRSLR